MSANPKPQILVVDDDPEILNLLRLLLIPEGYAVVTAGSGEEGWEIARRQPPDIAILDVMLPGMDGYALCRKLRETPTTRSIPILMLTAKGEVSDKIAGFDAGTDDYLIKPFHGKELLYRIKRLLEHSQAPVEMPAQPKTRGQTIAVFSTKGGAGKTTIAVNLAVALQNHNAGSVVLVDGDLTFGEVGMFLNLPSVRSILDLAKNIDYLEPELVKQVVIPHASGLRVLLSPFRPEQAELITADQVKRILDMLAGLYNYIVVDCNSSYEERMLVVLERADAILLVVPPEIGPLKNSDLFLQVVEKLKVSPEKVYLVLNRANSNVGMDAKEIERFFKRPLSFQIASGGRAVTMSANRGAPLVLEQPSHLVSRSILQIADFLIRELKNG